MNTPGSHQLCTRFTFRRKAGAAAIAALVFIASFASNPAVHAATIPGLALPQAQDIMASLPLRFEANNGVTDKRVKFLSRGPGYTLFLTPTEAVMSLQSGGAGQREKGRVGGWKNGGKSQTVNIGSLHSPIHPSVTTLRMKLANANPTPTLQGVDEMKARTNYFIGSDPKSWRTDVVQYQKVRYSSVYPGIDLVYYGNGRQLEYDFIVKPGADPRKIGLDVQGADELSIDRAGNLVIHSGGGEITWRHPTLYQDVNGARKPIEGRYIIHSGRVGQESQRISFAVASYDRNQSLTIDPVMAYSTYLGGDGYDYAWAVAVDSSGNAYIAGYTQSPFSNSTPIPFPTTASGRQLTSAGGQESFFSKIDTTKTGAASLVYSSYLGGSVDDTAYGIAADNFGNAYITGQTSSNNFPTTSGALLTTNVPTTTKVFVTKIDTTKSGAASLAYSTYLGGSNFDTGTRIAVDSAGIVYVTGSTSSSTAGGGTPFPTTAGAIQSTFGGNSDAYLAKIDTTKSGLAGLLYSTYLGGSDGDYGWGVAVDSSGYAYVVGHTASVQAGPANTHFPFAANGYQTTKRGATGSADLFVTKIDTTKAGLAGLLYSTYLGGSNDENAYGIAADGAGNAYITGETQSIAGGTNVPFPTTATAYQNAFQGANPRDIGFRDVIVSKIDTTQTGAASLVYSTYLGGNAFDEAHGIAVDMVGKVYITGLTNSSTSGGGTPFPITPNAIQPTFAGNQDAFLTVIDPTQSGAASLFYSSYLGGTGSDTGNGIALDSLGNAYVAGRTDSTNTAQPPAAPNGTFPTTGNAYQPNSAGTAGQPDAFLTKITFYTWRTTDISVGSDNQVHLLWGSASSQYGLWNINTSFTPTGQGPSWGPIQNWSAAAISTASNGLTSLLWTRTDGSAGLWKVDSSFNPTYGPVWTPGGGWSASDVSVDSGGSSHILWTNSNGQAGLWTVDSAFNVTGGPAWAAGGGWTAKAVCNGGAGGLTTVLWTRTDGSAGIWRVNSAFTPTYGPVWTPGGGWTAADIGVDSGGITNVLWTNSDGHFGLWKVDSSFNATSGPSWGPYPGWTAKRVAAGGSDGTVKILLSNQDGHMGYWSVDGGFNVTGGPAYGPY